MSTIEAILVCSKRVKGHARKIKWKQYSLALMCDSPLFSVKVITHILRRFIVTLYIFKNFKKSIPVCSLARSQLCNVAIVKLKLYFVLLY